MLRFSHRPALLLCLALVAGCGQDRPLAPTARKPDAVSSPRSPQATSAVPPRLASGSEPYAVAKETRSTRGGNQQAATEDGAFFSRFEIVDLSHAFDKNTVYWPTASGFKLKVDSFGVTDKGYFYAANSFCTAEHGGTHIDAPIHFFKGQETVDKIPLDRLMGEGIVIDVRQQCSKDRDYRITVGDLRDWEERHSRQLVDVIVFLRTGFAAYWPDRRRYMGTDERGAEALTKLHFPGLHPAAAQWLGEHRSIKAIGIDTPSIDFGQSSLFQSHVRLFEKSIPALENVASLDKLPEQGFQVIALPMKIAGGSGGPTRIVALVPKDSD